MELPGLDFAPGLKLKNDLWLDFRQPVSRSTWDRSSFVLVAAFGRCKFRLSLQSVGFILQATIGSSVTHFKVVQLGDRVFRFVVASRSIGLFVVKLYSFSCSAYEVFFHLWGNGGPN